MRPKDLQRLAKPFEAEGDREQVTAQALSVDASQWRRLDRTVFADLVAEPPYGLSWMVEGTGTKLRILVSDYLYCCVSSVRTHLREAGLHALELRDAVDLNEAQLSNSLVIDPRLEVVRFLPPNSPLEDLSSDLVGIHRVGTVRAAASALDCVAGAVVGVVGLKTTIFRAGWPGVSRLLKELGPDDDDVVKNRQREFREALEAQISKAGPRGWLDWVYEYRNMLVHRGRRIEVGQFRLGEPEHGSRPRVESLMHMPRDPARSDVEVRLDHAPPRLPLLTEDAETTVFGALGSTLQLVDGIADLLIEFVEWRRQQPQLLAQPAQQWLGGPTLGMAAFEGYAPGTLEYDPAYLVGGGEVFHRLRAAALDDASRGQWRTFD